MKKGKKMIGIVIIILIVVLILLSLKNPDSGLYDSATSLWELDEYKDIKFEDIQSIDITTYGEGGSTTELMGNPDEVVSTYQELSNIKVGRETKMSCDDNTVVYHLSLKDKKDASIEIECDWLVLQDRRYEIKK